MKHANATAASEAPARATGSILRYFAPLKTTTESRSEDPESSESIGSVDHERQAAVDETKVSDKHLPPTTAAPNLEPENAQQGDHAQASDASSHVSEYECKRLARIAQNAQFLRDLGMEAAQLDVLKRVAAPPKPKKKRLREDVESTEVTGTRRSSRLRGIPTSEPKAVGEEQVDHSPAPEDDSSVFQYTCRQLEGGRGDRKDTERPSGAVLVGFRASSDVLGDPTLKRIYSISFSPFRDNALIAAGGHQGQVSIYPSTPAKDIDATTPLLSFRAHRGWISSLSLAKSSPNGANRLLSAANDGVVKLWDLNRSACGEPKELFSVDNLHRNGIFGMDVAGDNVLTCSKDSTIAVSTFRESTLVVTKRYEDHDGVVKTVRFSPMKPECFVSGGNDRCIRIFDLRSNSTTATHVIENAHTRVINSVVWHPTQEHLLLSASFDLDMHLYDVRKPVTPLHVLRSSHVQAGNAIFHPSFVADGDYIVSTGSSTQDQLSLHRTADGSMVSRGQLPSKASYLACDPYSGQLLVALGQQMQIFDPEWQE